MTPQHGSPERVGHIKCHCSVRRQPTSEHVLLGNELDKVKNGVLDRKNKLLKTIG